MIAGQTLPLSCKLGDLAEDKYVLAFIRDETGAAVSTVPLLHSGEGLYESSAETMPAGVDFLTVSYVVYDDAAFSVVSDRYQNGTDVFDYSETDDTIIDKLNQIISTLNAVQGSSTGADLTGQVTMDATVLTGVIDELTSLRGRLVDETTLTGSIDADATLTGIIEDEGLTGEIDT